MNVKKTEHVLSAFNRIVKKYPDNNAIMIDGAHTLTYKELKQEALKLAQSLKNEGAGKETIVGLHIEKSADYLIGMMGAWYAGAAFMPLDPSLPEERLKYILDDSKVNILLSRKETAGVLTGEGRNVLDIATAKQASPLSKPVPRSLNDLAYVFYTSGSTGKPKGVEVTHNGIVPMLNAQIDAFNLNSNSRSLFYLSTSFDASVSDIGTAFLSGASLAIETASPQEIAANISNIIEDRGITYIDIPPSVLRILNPENIPPSLKSVTIGGEVLDPTVAREWAEKVRLVNVYGPTEATVCSSLCVIDPNNWNAPTIGNALPTVDYKVVNDDLSDTKQGMSGELLIGGAQLARGYLGRDDLNQAKFINVDGQRFYRSGDSVTVAPNNQYIFQGRIDRQVKIRGQLVELEEVEANILKNNNIAQAAVIKRQLNGGDALVAFIKPKNDQLSIDDLKQDLGRSLSPWMLPSHFENVESMPLTATGKIDLTALKSADLTVNKTPQNPMPQAESNTTEEKILSVWKKILKRDDLTLDDDFYDAGGDSLQLVQLAMEAELLGIEMTSNLVNEKKTIRAIAAYIDETAGSKNNAVIADAMPADDLRAAMALNNEWKNLIEQARNLPKIDDENPQNIFMTGANGFLASKLIYDLLNNSEGTTIHALVRAADEEKAMERIAQAVESHGFNLTPAMKDRIKPVCGDIAKPMMGMGEDKWSELTENVDTVMHSAAIVNMTASYDDLYGANVIGTQEAVKFALSGRRKKFHYASTLSVFVSTDQNTGDLLESDRLDKTQTVFGGYGQTKWAAEYFLHQIPSDVCDMSIHRLGLITGDTLTGKSSAKDFLNMFVHGITALGAVPDTNSHDIEVDVTPIDYSCEVLSHIMLQPEPAQKEGHKVYHIANKGGFSLNQILNELRSRGNHIDTLEPQIWLDKMARMKEAGFSIEESAAYFAISRMLPKDDILKRHTAMDLFQATGVKFCQENTQKMLEGTSITLPLPDNKLLSTYIDSITGQKKAISKRGVHKSMRKKTGMILGKFLPFHRGHEYLVDFARQYPDIGRLYVIVDRTKDSPIPQATRVKWIQDTFPDVSVLPLGDYNYQDPSEAPDEKTFWDQWEKSLKEAIPEPVDYVFNSEQYGWKLAEILGAKHVPVDRGRENFPISGTEMRKDPLKNWKYLPAVVRPYFLKKVCIVGAESTGKSTLAVNLAKHFNTAVVPEYARIFLESLAEKNEPRETNYDDLELFANGQIASETSLTAVANRILICDTDAITTKVWADTLYPDRAVPENVREMANENDYDFYIVANPDVEWKPDVHRQWEDESKNSRREAFNHRILAELKAGGKPYAEITGNDFDDRFNQAKEAIIRHVFKGREFSDFGAA